MGRRLGRPTRGSGLFVTTTLFAFTTLSLGLFFGTTAFAERVDNFVLLDQTGKAHELYYQSDASAVVIMAQGNGCEIVRNSIAEYQALSEQYAQRNVRFLMLNSNLQDNRANITKEAEEWGITLPILDDDTQIIGESLDLVRSGEVLVLNPENWDLVYRGPLNNRLTSEIPQSKATEHYVIDALENLLKTDPEQDSASVAHENIVQIEPVGCPIDFPERNAQHASISYSETIAPILQKNCTHCHVEGGIGPWAMTSYNMIRGFAPMIREVVRTKRMPPWHADPHIGAWQGDRRLSIEDTQTLVHWIEAGAPRGAGSDPLESLAPLSNEWPLGEPDLIVEIPGYEVPASGTVDYQFPYVENELDHGVWITAVTVLPGDRSVVHHVLAGSVEDSEPPSSEDSVMDNYIIGYAPGSESYVMPEGTGVYIAPGGFFTFQLHYTPTGKVTVDHSKMGLYLSDTPPANFLRHQVVVSPTISIPPNTAEHEEAAYYQFQDAAVIHTLFPHSHYRGRASTFELLYPDGRLETLLSVPNYDFNWQRGYNPVEPIAVPAGSRLIHRTIYDNSAQNPANPDPSKTIVWGLQSWEEMLYGAFSYSWVNETTDKPIHDRQLSGVTQFIGFLDKDMDGKLSWRELPDRMKKRLIQGFSTVDTNGDGGLDIEEFNAMQKEQKKREQHTAGAD